MHAATITDLGRCDYMRAHRLMVRLVAAKRPLGLPEMVLFVEHHPVLTMGRRGQKSDICASKAHLDHLGISVQRVERGGLVTYHGPGQQVVYVLFDLKKMHLGVADLVRKLEKSVVACCADFGVAAQGREDQRGVWVEDAKLASIGLAVRKQISFHGLALNRDPDLRHFDLIHPCGMPGVQITSLARQSDERVSAAALKQSLAHHLERQFQLKNETLPLAALEQKIPSDWPADT